MTNATRRSATSLMEVLVAIFILSIGLLSIMAFFPLGALNMAQSVKDDRTASIAANADAMGRIQWRKAYLAFDSSVNGDPVPYNFLEPGLHALDYPIPYGRAAFPLAWAPPGPAVLTPAERMAVDATLYPFGSPFTPADPSTPVLFDPIGFVNQSFNGPTYQRSVAGLEFPVGGVPLAVVPRRSFSDTQYYPTAFGFAPFTAYPPPTALQASIRTSALLDDMSFDLSGQPTNSGGQIDRGGRYNVAWLFQRPKQSARAEANMTILVFNARPLSDVAAQELAYPVNVFPGTTTMTLNVSSGRPPLKKNGWIMVASSKAAGGPKAIAEFYRVANITETVPGPGTLAWDIELEQPIRAVTNPATGLPVPNYNGFVVVFEFLSEVFDRGVISATAAPAQ